MAALDLDCITNDRTKQKLNKAESENIIKKCKKRLYESDFNNILGSTGRQLWHYTILGMNHISIDECFSQLNSHDSLVDANNILLENDRRCNEDDFMTYEEFIQKINS